jgi:hypothetical protein
MSYQVSKAPVQTNHVLHLILTLVTCGFWAPVWLIMAIINANMDKTTTTQTYGVQPVQQIQPYPAPIAASPYRTGYVPAPCVASVHIPWPGSTCSRCGATDTRFGG